MKDIIPVLTNHHNTLTRLHVQHKYSKGVLSFITSFINLQELVISHLYMDKKLQHTIFPNLQILKILHDDSNPNSGMFIKFLENNGKNLTDLYMKYYKDNSLNLSIIQHCLKLKNLLVIINNGEIDILKNIFNSCQYLKSIRIWCGIDYINEKGMLDLLQKIHQKVFID